jgi:hypothetical protein
MTFTSGMTSPTVKAPPWPKLFDTSLRMKIEMTNRASPPMKGMRTSNRNHAQVIGLPATFSKTMKL